MNEQVSFLADVVGISFKDGRMSQGQFVLLRECLW